MKNEKSTLMDETSNTELLELKLEEARKLLRLKKKKLKQYDRHLEAKQHVQETLKRFQVVEESQNDETSLDSSSMSEPRSNDSRSVKFSDDSPEVIFVTPTPDVYLSKKGRLKEKSKSKGYRSLSLSEKKTGNEEESQIKRIPPSDNSQTNAKRANHCTPSAETVVLEDKVNNNDNEETDAKDMFQSCEYNRNSSSPVLSQHSVINVRVDTQRRSGGDGIKHQNNGDNKKETEGAVQNCRDGGSSPVLSQRSVLSTTGPMQRSDGGHIKLENDGMIDLENDDFFDQDFSEVIEDKIISPKHSHQNKRIFDDSLNKWISEDSASNCRVGTSDVTAKSPEDENKELNTTFYFNSEWEENDIFEDSAIKKADIEASSIQRAKESPKKCTTKEEESQDLFSSILPTKYDGNDEPKKSYKSKLVLDNHSSKVPEMSKAHFGIKANGLRKENSLVSSNKRLVELNAGNEIEEENVHRRIRTNRVRHRLPKSSNSSDSNSEPCKQELLGEDVLRGTCSSLKENDQHAQEICSSGRKDLPAGVKSGNSDTIGNIVDPIDHITSVSCNQLETADTQLYSEVFNEGESAGTVSKDHKSHKTSQVCDEFIDCSSGVCKREDEKLNVCMSDVSPKSRSCRENSFSRKAVCAKQLFSKRLSSSSKAVFNENDFPRDGKGSGQCIPETPSITGENSNPLQDCDRSDMDGDLGCDERVSYFSLKPSDNLGKILSGSHGYFSPKPLERLYIVLVCELGISIWTRHSEDILKNGDNLLTNKEGDKVGGGGREMECGKWRVLAEKKHQIGDIYGVRHIVAFSLPSDEEEVRCLVAVSRNGDSALHVTHVQYDLEGGWLITERPIDISYGDQMNHLFGCALSDWSVVLCWNSIKSSPESFLVINFDVSYSRRSKKWELHCNTNLHSPEWSSHLRRFVPLNDTELQGYAICTLKNKLYLYNVAENRVVHQIEWNLSPVSWSWAIKDLLFVLSHDEEANETHLVAINPVNGHSESFYSWTLEKALNKCEEPLSLCSASLEDERLFVLYANGTVVNVHLSNTGTSKK